MIHILYKDLRAAGHIGHTPFINNGRIDLPLSERFGPGAHLEILPAGTRAPYQTIALVTTGFDRQREDHLEIQRFLEQLATLMMFDTIELVGSLH